MSLPSAPAAVELESSGIERPGLTPLVPAPEPEGRSLVDRRARHGRLHRLSGAAVVRQVRQLRRLAVTSEAGTVSLTVAPDTLWIRLKAELNAPPRSGAEGGAVAGDDRVLENNWTPEAKAPWAKMPPPAIGVLLPATVGVADRQPI